METKYIKIRDLEIPISISIKKLLETLKISEEDIYNKYKEITESGISLIKQWTTGEKIYYKGEEYSIIRKRIEKMRISITIEETQKQIIIAAPENISQEDLKINIDKGIKRLFKRNTEIIIANRLPYWSKIMGFNFNQVKVRDAIIVHELCHMKFKNHSKEFYDLVSTYIPDYKEIDKWLRVNGKMIMF